MENKASFVVREEPLICSQIKNFWEFAAMLPHIAQKSFVQRASRVVAANENMAAKGHFSQKCSEKRLYLTKFHYVFKEKSVFLLSIIGLGSL